jgi:hypothetical protein
VLALCDFLDFFAASATAAVVVTVASMAGSIQLVSNPSAARTDAPNLCIGDRVGFTRTRGM